MFLGEGCVPGAAPPTFPVPGVTYMAATCLGATSRRASAPPLVTPPARGLPPARAQPGSPAELRAAAAAPPPRAPLPQRAAVRPPRPAPGRKAGGLVTCPRRSRNSSGGEESFPNIRGIKKSLPQLSSSSNRLSKNISSTTEKTVHQTLDDDHPCDFFKKGNRVNESHQKSSNMNAGPSRNKEQRSKNASGKRQSKPQVPHVSSQLKGSLVGVSQLTGDKHKESISPKGKPERSPLSSRCQGASGNKLFLDFKSLKIIKEDADEDSASDLSDSERIPIPPSPLTPPDLNLRAEEIDPVYFDLDPGQGQAKLEYHYPDFLPPPFNSWDLRDMAVLLNTEYRTGAMPHTGGLLGKYVDRLIELEWLQIQTVQSEKGKGAKARPPTAPGTSGALKSPGRSKLIASALSKTHQEGAPQSGPSRRKDLHREEVHPSYYTLETSPKPLEVLSSSRLCSQEQTFDMRTEEKKKKSNKSSKLQHWGLSCADSSPKIDSSGNTRVPPQSVMILGSVDSYKASRTQAHANLKKKGKANNCGHATISSERKLKTNGVKQNTHKFK